MELRNTIEQPDNVTMKELDITGVQGTAVVLPKLSWNIIVLG